MLVNTERFYLKPLSKKDATSKYLNWLIEESKKEFILSAGNYHTIESIEDYILSIENNKAAILFGIFDKATDEHIGNIKYDKICDEKKSAVMGILIGELNWRGKGVAPEVILGTSKSLRDELNIQSIILGVKTKNVAAVKSYTKMGFYKVDDPVFENNGEALKMCLDTKNLS
jgi:RimJ/RimL family protein N-acetyltransferase